MSSTQGCQSPSTAFRTNLFLHLVVGSLEITIVLRFFVLLRMLLRSLGKVNLAATSATSIGNDILGVNLLHVVVIGLVHWGW